MSTLNELLASLDDSVAMEKSAQVQVQKNVGSLSLDELVKLAEDEGERAAAEMAATRDAENVEAEDKEDNQTANEEDPAADDGEDSEANKEDDEKMNKEAFLKKLAEMTVTDSDSQPQVMLENQEEQVAMDDAKVQPTPATDAGVGDLLTAIVENAEARANAAGEGVQNGDEVEPVEDAVVKAAALDDLMAQGYSFEDAADMVKAAADAVAQVEYSDIEKAAAVGELMARGVDFAEAVDLVKEAAASMILSNKKHDKPTAMGKARAAVEDKVAKGKARVGAAKKTVTEAAKVPMEDRVFQAGAQLRKAKVTRSLGSALTEHPEAVAKGLRRAGAVGVAGAALGAAYAAGHHQKKASYSDMDKQAAVAHLMDNGVDFNTAVALVQEAAE